MTFNLAIVYKNLWLIKSRTIYVKVTHFFGFIKNFTFENDIKVVQRLTICGQGDIKIGKSVSLGVYPSPGFIRGELYLEARAKAAKITIGNNVYINNNAVIIADKSEISIGDNTLIGPNFSCYDSDFHSIKPDERLSNCHKSKPIKIGKNVFIGANVLILKGVNIGDNSVIGAGTIVDEDVPENKVYKRNHANELFEIRP